MILLAPMEGLADFAMRQVLTDIGGFDYCVSEFLRISNQLLPAKVFYRHCPELHNGSQTRAGTPMYLQLLGSSPQLMAANAVRGAQLGAKGIDLNFGCPSKIVNRHDGGSSLLKTPDRVFNVVKAVREAVPAEIPVTAKIRLGFDDTTLAVDNALATQEGGATWLTVHARTRKQGYQPPAHWDWLARLNEHVDIPIIANGEIWSLQDYQRCVSISGCEHVMLGRGVISQPDLALQIAENSQRYSWQHVAQLLLMFTEHLAQSTANKFVANRLKQWLGFLLRQYPAAQELFDLIKREKDLDLMQAQLKISIAG